MYIFEKDYPYKLIMLGYATTRTQDEEVQLIFIKTHEKIFTLRHYFDAKEGIHNLKLTEGISESEIKIQEKFAICKDEIILERMSINKNFDIYKVPYPGLAIALYNDNDEIISCKYFSMQLSTNILIGTQFDLLPLISDEFLKFLKNNQ